MIGLKAKSIIFTPNNNFNSKIKKKKNKNGWLLESCDLKYILKQYIKNIKEKV